MMLLIFNVLYGLLVIMMCLLSLFILYHIFYYSYSKSSKLLMVSFFVPVTVIMLIVNYVLFSQIPFESLLPNL